MPPVADASPAERKRGRSITLPADLVPHFEAAVRRRDIPVGVTYHDGDGSQTYHVDAEAWDGPAVIAAAEEGVAELRATLNTLDFGP